MKKRENNKTKKIKVPFSYGYLLLAVLLAVVGALFIYYNDASVKIALGLGILLVLFAAYRFAAALSDKNRGATFVVRLVVAFAVLLGGVATIIFRNGVAEIMLSLVALALIIDGSFKLQLTADLKTYTRPLFWVMLVLATGVIAGAFIALRFPPASAEKNSIFLGAMLIVDAFSNVFSPFGIRSCEKAKRAAVAEPTPAAPAEPETSEAPEEKSEKKRGIFGRKQKKN